MSLVNPQNYAQQLIETTYYILDKAEIDVKKSCAVCLEDLIDENVYVAHPDGGEQHPFDVECALEALKRNSYCPCCRVLVSKKPPNKWVEYTLPLQRLENSLKKIYAISLIASVILTELSIYANLIHWEVNSMGISVAVRFYCNTIQTIALASLGIAFFL